MVSGGVVYMAEHTPQPPGAPPPTETSAHNSRSLLFPQPGARRSPKVLGVKLP